MDNVIAVKQEYDKAMLESVSIAVTNGISSALDGKYHYITEQDEQATKSSRITKEEKERELTSLKNQFMREE